MARGRKPKSTAEHERDGTGRHDRHGARPRVAAGCPMPPATLSKEAKAEWQRAVRDLGAAGLLAKLDRSVLALYCQAWADYWAAKSIVQKEGWTAVGSTGNVIEHPAAKVMQRAWQQCFAAAREFGMSPSARGSIKMADPGPRKSDAGDDEDFFP